MAITYSYTHGDTGNRNRLRLLLGDNRGVNNTYATSALWISGSSAMFCDEELDDFLIIANGGSAPSSGDGGAILAACRLCIQSRMNRESMAAGVSGTTDTTDRPSALLNALNALQECEYGIASGQVPTS